MPDLKLTDSSTREMIMRELADVADLRMEPVAIVAQKVGISIDQLDHLLYNRMEEVGIDTIVRILTKSGKTHTVIMDGDGFLKDMDAAMEVSYREFDELRKDVFEADAYKKAIRKLISKYVVLNTSTGHGFCG